MKKQKILSYFVRRKREVVAGFVFGLLIFLPISMILNEDTRSKRVQKISNKPLLELKNFTFVEVDKNGTSKVVSGSLGYHFSDREYISDLNFRQKTKDTVQTLVAKNAEKKSGVLYFTGSVSGNNGSGVILNSESAKYTESSKLLDITSKFVVYDQKHTIYGDSGSISANGKKVTANNIKATIKTDKK